MEKDAQLQLHGLVWKNAQWQPGKWVEMEERWDGDLLIHPAVQLVWPRKTTQALT